MLDIDCRYRFSTQIRTLTSVQEGGIRSIVKYTTDLSRIYTTLCRPSCIRRVLFWAFWDFLFPVEYDAFRIYTFLFSIKPFAGARY